MSYDRVDYSITATIETSHQSQFQHAHDQPQNVHSRFHCRFHGDFYVSILIYNV